ncbi:MAG: PKD domain-containing protein [Thermoplasmatales archaeon]|nr:PKD domain-containing protein [Thermoplasmatales archaeon]
MIDIRKKINRNQKITIIFTAILLTSIIAVESIHSEENNTLISIEDLTLKQNEIKSLKIFIHNVNNLGSFKISISYDSAILNVVHVGNGEIDEIFTYLNATQGVLNITGYNISAITTDEICIAEIVFKAVGSDGESCDLIIVFSELLSADPTPIEIPHETSNGKVTIKGQSSSGGGGGGGPNGGTSGGGGDEGNSPPIADASDSETMGFVDTPVNFDGSNSYDSDGTITDYTWNFGDGTTGHGITTTHIYTEPGTFTVTLTVTDDGDATDEDTIQVVISQPNNPPTAPDVDGPQTGTQNTVYTYTAVSTDGDNDKIRYTFDWGDGTTKTTDFYANNTEVTETHNWSAAGAYTVTVIASDNATESGTTSLLVLIDAMAVGDIGYLLDTNGDGTYNSFKSTETGGTTDSDKQDDGAYYIDSDGTEGWDWVYDPVTDTLTEYAEGGVCAQEEDNTMWYVAAILIISIILIIVYLFAKKKK